VLFIRDKINGNYVGLLIANKPESSKPDFFQEVETLLLGQLLDDHGRLSYAD
jgi:hypothetical protein